MNELTYIPAELETLETILQTLAYGGVLQQRQLLAHLMEDDTTLISDPLNVAIYLARAGLNVLKDHLKDLDEAPIPVLMPEPVSREMQLMAELGY